MSPSPVPKPSVGAEAAVLFSRFLHTSAGDHASFAALCALRPDLATDLRALLCYWERLDPGAGGSEPAEPVAPQRAVAAECVFERGPEIGKGGMGIVYRTTDPTLGRPLALKSARATGGVESAELRERRYQRFLREARITGRLQHAGIVPVHHLGMDERGCPFFTMQLVEGETLAVLLGHLHGEAGDRGNPAWSLARIIGVLLRVCETLAFAHSEGVIHRDLKPANIMVGRFGEVYVMDWGLARETSEMTDAVASIGQDGDAADHATRDGQVLGTACYMSPEQATGTLTAIDARTDVYAMGAVLYHILVGLPPYVGAGVPPDPLAILAALRSGSPRSLAAVAPHAPRELRAICAKAMARDRGERYAGIGALGDDLRAWLEGRVVGAADAGAMRVLLKWVARNRGLAAALATALVVTLGGGCGLALQQRSHSRALRLERDEARGNERAALQAVDFIADVFGQVSPLSARRAPHDLLLRDAFAAAARRLDSTAATDPRARGLLHRTIGALCLELGETDNARLHLQQAEALLCAEFGADHPEALGASIQLAETDMFRPDADKADLRDRLAALASRAVAALGADHRVTRLARRGRAAADHELGDDRAASAGLRELLGDLARNGLSESSEAASAWYDLGVVLAALGDVPAAEQAYAEAARLTAMFDDAGSGRSLTIAQEVAALRSRAGDAAGAEAAQRDIAARCATHFGAGHGRTRVARLELCETLEMIGNVAESEQIIRELLAQVPTESADAVLLRARLGMNLVMQERNDEADELLSGAMRWFDDHSGGDDLAMDERVRYPIAMLRLTQERHAEALALFVASVDARRRRYGDEHEMTLWAEYGLGRIESEQNPGAQGARALEHLLGRCRRAPGENNYLTFMVARSLAWHFHGRGDLAPAIPVLEFARQCGDACLGPANPKAVETVDILAVCLWRSGRHTEAAGCLRDLLRRTAAGSPEHQRYERLLQSLPQQEPAEAH